MSSIAKDISNSLRDLVSVKVLHYDAIDSTNTCAMNIAPDLQDEIAIVIADSQSAGRGRRGNKWFSPKGNLYMSVILKQPETSQPFKAQGSITNLLTLMSGIAIVEAIEQTCGYSPSLKWPNDIMAEGLKIGGVLAESRFEGSRLNFLVIGIGVNLVPLNLPDEIIGRSASLYDLCCKKSFSRETLAASIARSIVLWYRRLASGQTERILKKWTLKSSTLNRIVRITDDNARTTIGTAQGIDILGRLIIKTESGNYIHIENGSLLYT